MRQRDPSQIDFARLAVEIRGAWAQRRIGLTRRKIEEGLVGLSSAPLEVVADGGRHLAPLVGRALDESPRFDVVAPILSALGATVSSGRRWRAICAECPSAATFLLRSLARAEWGVGAFVKAMAHARSAVVIAKRGARMGNPTVDDIVSIASSLRLLAWLECEFGDTDRAIQSANRSEAWLSRLSGSDRSLAAVRSARFDVQGVLCRLLLGLGKFNEVIRGARRGIKLIGARGRGPSGGVSRRLMLIDMRLFLAEALLGLRMEVQAMQLARDVQASLTRRFAREVGRPSLAFLRSRCSLVIGDAAMARGEISPALAQWRIGLRGMLSYASKEARDASTDREIAVLSGRIGRCLCRQMRYRSGRQRLRFALRREHARVRAFPRCLDAWRGIEFLLRELGESYRSSRRYVRSSALLVMAERIARRLVVRWPMNHVVRRDLAVILTDLVVTHNRLGDYRSSIRSAAAASSVLERLARTDGRTARWHVDRAWLHEVLSDVHDARGAPGQSKRELLSAARCLKRALRLDSSNRDAEDALVSVRQLLSSPE